MVDAVGNLERSFKSEMNDEPLFEGGFNFEPPLTNHAAELSAVDWQTEWRPQWAGSEGQWTNLIADNLSQVVHASLTDTPDQSQAGADKEASLFQAPIRTRTNAGQIRDLARGFKEKSDSPFATIVLPAVGQQGGEERSSIPGDSSILLDVQSDAGS